MHTDMYSSISTLTNLFADNILIKSSFFRKYNHFFKYLILLWLLLLLLLHLKLLFMLNQGEVISIFLCDLSLLNIPSWIIASSVFIMSITSFQLLFMNTIVVYIRPISSLFQLYFFMSLSHRIQIFLYLIKVIRGTHWW